MFKVAVIGLGNIGFKLNLDPLRKEIWSHVSAYEKCDKTELVGAVEVNNANIKTFREHHKDIPVYNTVREMMENASIEIVSICTPTESHYSVLKELLNYPVKGIFCEKPLASNVMEAKEMVWMCEEREIALAVNHTRRWDDNYLLAKRMIQDGKIGRIKAVNALYPGQIFNIGTHLFDTIRMMIERDAKTVSGVSFNIGNDDPSVSGWIHFNENIFCTLFSTGKREDLIFEVDIIGDEGRIRILENGERIEWHTFSESSRYSGYRELSLMPMEPISKKDRFIEAINDIITVIEGGKKEVNCSGKDGLWALALTIAMRESAKKNGNPINLRI
jgi:UDP-N-acetylglucosamine 3-dehydrogenase